MLGERVRWVLSCKGKKVNLKGQVWSLEVSIKTDVKTNRVWFVKL